MITDLQETMDALVQAADMPLSILIVGVGGADFKEMEVCKCNNLFPQLAVFFVSSNSINCDDFPCDPFSQILDADKGERLESTTGRVAVRDIVQFVPLRDVQSRLL